MVSQLLCDQSFFSHVFVLASFLFSLFIGESIQSHPNVFLESEQVKSQPSSGIKTKGEQEGGRRASMTSVESETSVCFMGQLGNIITNSEWK